LGQGGQVVALDEGLASVGSQEEKYRRFADGCFDMASRAGDVQFRDNLIEMAREWLKLADEAKTQGRVFPSNDNNS
jgi:hypothetical protein